MKVSGFTFLRNAHKLGYPFLQSIRSVLPLCDEFIINVGPCEDDTLEQVRSIADAKIRIIENSWNEAMQVRGFVYSQQTNIALFNCSGDWAFYIQGDEVIHEEDLPAIRAAMEANLHDSNVEALLFDYVHLYGNHQTQACSPGWYRREVRIVRNTIKIFSPSDAQFFVVLDTNRRARYPRVKPANGRIFHYGWVRSEEQMNERQQKVEKYWGNAPKQVDYTQIDQAVLQEYRGTHPAIMAEWLPKDTPGLFRADPHYQLTKKDRRYRTTMKLERLFGLELGKKHYKLLR